VALRGLYASILSSFASVRSTCFQPTVGMPRFMNEISRSPNMGKPWPRGDLFFLEDSLERGMSLVEIAGFLGRTADEVREKAKDLNR
jgi:hypothetical protein